MTESAKIAKLWSNFHRLSEGDKGVVLGAAEIIAWREKPLADKDTSGPAALEKKAAVSGELRSFRRLFRDK